MSETVVTDGLGQIFGTVYCALNLSILAVGVGLKNETLLFTTTRSVAFISSASILPLAVLEHRRSVRPSFLLCVYLLFSILFDIAHTRTLWLISIEAGQTVPLARLCTAAVAAKILLLVLESQRKPIPKDRSLEDTSGLFNLVAYTWLVGLFRKGYFNVLSLKDLAKLDQNVASEVLHQDLSIMISQAQANPSMKKFGLARALTRTLLRPLLYPILPRLALVGFRFCQPFLIHSLLDHMENHVDGDITWRNKGYGFIGAAVIIYFGVAVSTALYWYCHERVQAMTRGALVAAIYHNLMQLRIIDVNDSAAITLMSTDIERIRVGLLNLHEFWATPIEVALASWLLYAQIGVAFVAPLVVVILSVACSAVLNRYTQPGQKRWMDRIQTRVAETAQMLTNIKQLKVSALAHPVEESTQQLRIDEMEAASKFRRLYVSNMAFGFAPMALCPVITFAVTSRNLDIGTVFTSLAYLVLLADPLGILFGEIPYLVAAFTSIGRIQEFLSKDRQAEHRLFYHESRPVFSATEIDLKNSLSPDISVENATIGWNENDAVFRNVSIKIPPSSLTMLVGPVGSGKSTLCKTLLGQVPFVSGGVTTSTPADHFRSAFCDQSPYIYNNTIRQNITGSSLLFDEVRYGEVIESTSLIQDLNGLPEGANTIVGSSGMTLSGGQKQRLSMARALYHHANFYVFDDSLSGLDADTELKVFSRVFGPTGILARRKSTVILATHNIRLLPFAQHVIVLDADSTVVYQGDYSGLTTAGLHQHSELHLRLAETKGSLPTDIHQSESSQTEAAVLSPNLAYTTSGTSFLSDRDRMTGDSTVYRYYLASLGKASFIAFGLFGIGWGFFYNFGYIWLRFWSEDSKETHSKAYYIGLYFLWQASGLISIVLCFWMSYTMMARISGLSLHRSALRSVIRAPLYFTTSTDIGVITNLFSQDMTLVDNELPMAVTNLVLDVCNALGLAAVIATSSPYLAVTYPVLIGMLYFVQKVYLRTSRQVRLLDLEAKSPL